MEGLVQVGTQQFGFVSEGLHVVLEIVDTLSALA